MSYDPVAGSVRLLEGVPPSDVARLSRRVRFVPLAVDRDGDVAATSFLGRGGSGAALLDTHVLERTADRWRLLGGGGGPGSQALAPRPGQAEIGVAVYPGAGGVARSGNRLLPWPGRDGWISFAEVRAARNSSPPERGSPLADFLVPQRRLAAMKCSISSTHSASSSTTTSTRTRGAGSPRP